MRVGDVVMSYDVATGRLEPRRVLETYRRVSNHLRILQIESQDGGLLELRTTDEHPFWVQDKGWVKASMLALGQMVMQSDRTPATLVSTRRVEHPEGITVFNFQVERFHNYFVTHDVASNFILVHNAEYTPDQQALQQLVNQRTNNGRTPLSVSEANTVLDWANEIGYPGIRAGPGDVGAGGQPPNWIGGPHIHMPGAGRHGHIPVAPGLQPR